MRIALILLLLFAPVPLTPQGYISNVGKKTMDDGAVRIEAPVFGTGDYFRTHFAAPYTKVQVKAPSRLADFIVDGHLELSLHGYLELVLANNTQIAIQKLNIETPRNAITRALGRFDPTIDTNFRTTRRVTPTSDALQGAQTLSQLTQPFSLNYNQTLDTGTSYSVGFSGSKRSTNSTFATFNPSVNGSLNVSVTQPLIRNFGRRVNRLQVMVAQSRFQRSRENLRDQLLRLLAIAENVYWSVVDARENLRVSEENLRLNDALLKRSERELQLGAISPLDIYQPQQNRANAELFLTQSSYRLAQTLDALRTQIGADLDPDYRTVPIVLTEAVLPPANEAAIDPESMVEIAYRLRPDLRGNLRNLEIDDLSHDVATNQLRPDLSLSLNYSTTGLGGDFSEFAGFDGGRNASRVLLRTIPGGVGDMLGQVFGFDFPSYGFTLNLRLPIRDRAAVANLADAVVSKKLDSLRAQNLQQTIRLEVLTAVNQLESSKARVKLAQTSLEFSQKRLDAEQKKYDLGVTTIFLLIQAQNDLVSARSEVVTQATLYRRNLTQLLRVTGQLLEKRGVVVRD